MLSTARFSVAIGSAPVFASTVFNASSVSGDRVAYAVGAGGRKNCGTALAYDTGVACPTGSYFYDPLISRLSRFGASAWYIGNGSSGRPSADHALP